MVVWCHIFKVIMGIFKVILARGRLGPFSSQKLVPVGLHFSMIFGTWPQKVVKISSFERFWRDLGACDEDFGRLFEMFR